MDISKNQWRSTGGKYALVQALVVLTNILDNCPFVSNLKVYKKHFFTLCALYDDLNQFVRFRPNFNYFIRFCKKTKKLISSKQSIVCGGNLNEFKKKCINLPSQKQLLFFCLCLQIGTQIGKEELSKKFVKTNSVSLFKSLLSSRVINIYVSRVVYNKITSLVHFDIYD